MKFVPTIISRYLIRSFIPPFLAALLFFTFIILIFYLKEIIKSAVEKGVPVDMVMSLFSYSMGWTLGLTVPMATLMAVIMTIGGLNADSEVIAMRAGGITYGRIMRPFLAFGVLVTVFLIWFNQSIIPLCIKQMKVITLQILNHDPIAIIEPGQFTKLDKTENSERHIYIETVQPGTKDAPARMLNIQIRKTEKVDKYFQVTELIVAPEGIKIKKKLPDGNFVKALRLFKGYIFTQNRADKTFQRIDFSKGKLDLNLQTPEEGKVTLNKNDKQSLPQSVLVNQIATLRGSPKLTAGQKKTLLELRLEYHKRIALPFAVLSLLVLGFPLGIVNKRSGKGMGFGISIVFIFVYYVVFLSSDAMAVQYEILPPLIAAWMGNLIISLIGGYVFFARTTDVSLFDFVKTLQKRFTKAG